MDLILKKELKKKKKNILIEIEEAIKQKAKDEELILRVKLKVLKNQVKKFFPHC